MTSFLPEQTAIQEVFGNEVSYHPLTPVVTVIHRGPCHPGIFDSQNRFISAEYGLCSRIRENSDALGSCHEFRHVADRPGECL